MDGLVFIKNSNGVITACTRENESPVTLAPMSTTLIEESSDRVDPAKRTKIFDLKPHNHIKSPLKNRKRIEEQPSSLKSTTLCLMMKLKLWHRKTFVTFV